MPTGFLSFLLEDIWQANAKTPGNDIQNHDTIPTCCIFSVHGGGGQKRAAAARPAFVVVHLWLRFVASPHSLCRSALRYGQISLYSRFTSSKGFLFVVFFSFLQLCFSCSSPQNRFSSKIAIKSLWKFMSIVAAICGERRTTEHPIYIYTPGGGFSGSTTTNVRIFTIKSKGT